MAKLSELKTLYDAARVQRESASAPVRSGAPAAARPKSAAPGASRSHSARTGTSGGGSTKRLIAAAKHADGDVDLSQVFADVQRLPASNKVATQRVRPHPVPHQRLRDEKDALEASKYGVEPAPHAWEIGQETESEQTFLRAGLRSDVLTKLRRGHWVVQAVLDLHGMTADEARDTLADFLLEARNQGMRCVRVIHGKGLTSPNREPVLKGRVRKWLSHWDDVLSFCEAPANAGGAGAVHVLLVGR